MYCSKCRVNVKGENQKCPLCQSKIDGDKTNNIFPKVKTVYQIYDKFFKWLLFGTILSSVIAFVINLLLNNKLSWSLFVIYGNICLIIILVTTIKHRYNIPKVVFRDVVILSILSYLWDYYTGNIGWSINFVIPILCGVGSINLMILSFIMESYINKYLFYFILVVIFGNIPLLFILGNHVTIFLPSYICVILNLFIFVFLIIFKHEKLIKE